ncbi:DUF6770 family protein [Flavisolibacter nicotianae]|uniref:DUF6770 family protein n=1 Tax=Flavisolibacter nicotianae TaxID=2364882 RepID=UPI0013C41E56|nr:DUF6770 family protein [Flavisolibacter nicotianae]
MKKTILSLLGLSVMYFFAGAQSKVFKEVGDEIRSQVQLIRQDQSLVGYLALTQLEKASEDSFNYRLTIMDENLNDIGKLEFREQNLDLHSVAFDQDVICLGYFKSFNGKSFPTKKDFEAAKAKGAGSVFFQFVTLDGKILKTASLKSKVDAELLPTYVTGKKNTASVRLSKSVQLSNVSQKGFAAYFQDSDNGHIAAFDLKGTQLWDKKLATKNPQDYLLATNEDVYVLSQKSSSSEGGWEARGYSFADATDYDKLDLKDKKGNSLRVIGWGSNPVSGRPYVSGMIINPDRSEGVQTMKGVTKSPYFGVFTIDLNGRSRKDFKETFSYWNDGSKPGISEKGRFEEKQVYPFFDQSYKDYDGNTVFVGSSVKRKLRWGSIATGVVLSPLIVVSPMIWMMTGFNKYQVTDASLLKQSGNGELKILDPIACNNTGGLFGRGPIRGYGINKSFHRVTNSETKTDFVVVDDIKDIVIYNMNKQKTVRTIPHKDGNINTGVMPAKDGHIMVVEYNKKEKYTRVSIEQI